MCGCGQHDRRRGMCIVFIMIQWFTLLAGTDLGQPRYTWYGAAPAPLPALLGAPRSYHEARGLVARFPGAEDCRRVARLRGGSSGDDTTSAKLPSPKGQSWADLVRQPGKSRSPSTNPGSGDGTQDAAAVPAGSDAGAPIPVELLVDMKVADGSDDTGKAGAPRAGGDAEGNAMPFMTDAEICELAAKQQGPENKAGQDRELEPYECDDDVIDGRLEDDPDAELDHRSKRVKDFDQFKLNEEKFGIKTNDFNEDDYTAPINKQDPAFAEQVHRAEKLAAEIEGSWTSGNGGATSNLHLRDERNLPLPDDVDEATLYSTVNPPRPSDPVAGQLMSDDATGAAPGGDGASGKKGGSERPLSDEEDEVKSEEFEAVLQGAYDRISEMVENGEAFPPAVEALMAGIQVRRCVLLHTLFRLRSLPHALPHFCVWLDLAENVAHA